MLKSLRFLGIIGAGFFAALAVSAVPSVITPLDVSALAPFSSKRGVDDFYKDAVVHAAKSALNAGMPSLSKEILVSNMAKSSLLRDSVEVNGLLVDTLISLGEFAEAQAPLNVISRVKTSENALRAALVLCGLGKSDRAEVALLNVDETKLSDALKPWLHIARGYYNFERGDNAASLVEFRKAKSLAKTSLAAADAEVGMNISKLAAPASESDLEKMAEDLKNRVSVFMGTPEGFQFAKQYAAVLFRLGREAEALDVINQQLEIALAPEIDKEELNLINASMTKDSARKIAVLKNILRKTSSENVAKFAIELISSNKSISVEQMTAFLKDVLENSSAKIKDKIILELAKNAVRIGNRAEAAAFAQSVLDKFPDSKYRPDALRILAWAAWTSPVPQYRLAAAYLDELALSQTSPAERAYIMSLAASCYYRDGDFATAANIYETIFDEIPEKQGVMLNRIVDARLRQNEEPKAVAMLERAYKSHNIGENDLWNAEWKIISHYRLQNQIGKALDRIEAAIASKTAASPLLGLRMMWLRAVISERLGDAAKTMQYCDNIVDTANSEKISDRATAAEIAANALLLKASCLERSADSADKLKAIATYELIRTEYPDTEAAPLSYIHQARVEARLGRYAKAQELCVELSEAKNAEKFRYPALFDAAEYMKKIATEQSFKSALSLLDKLCSDYPEDSRNFYARLSQADILRLLNSFQDARKLYNEILNKFEKHPEIYLAWLGLGDAILTQSANRATDAVAIFERLYSLPDIPVAARAEAACKWAFALEKSGRKSESNEVAWLTSNALLKDSPKDAVAQYWIGRTLYTLARSLEERGLNRDAKSAYELIVKYGLPTEAAAKQKIKNSEK